MKKPNKNFYSKNHQYQEIPSKKKRFGQHFLRKQSVVDHMISKVTLTPQTTVLEIGCGDGFLTQAILSQSKTKQLICYEIDSEWAEFVKNKIHDSRLDIRLKNILEVDFNDLKKDIPMVVLANLPYQITFPILFLFQKNKHLFSEGVVMIQEEVAQKLVAKNGRSYSATSLFLQHHFYFELMEKIEPGAFTPPPKVYSRLIYFKPKVSVTIPSEEEFWKFLKLCFISPRRTLRNNLKTTHYNLETINSNILDMRAQQLSFEEFLDLWNKVITNN